MQITDKGSSFAGPLIVAAITQVVCLIMTHDVCFISHDVCFISHDVCFMTNDVWFVPACRFKKVYL